MTEIVVPTRPPPTRLQSALSLTLTVGLFVACLLVAVGGIMLLTRQGGWVYERTPFDIAKPGAATFGAVWRAFLAGEPAAIIMAGVALLILTPVARVVMSLILFAIERDRLYVVICLIVLALLGVGLFVKA